MSWRARRALTCGWLGVAASVLGGACLSGHALAQASRAEIVSQVPSGPDNLHGTELLTRRSRAHALAAEGDWTAAADEFTSLAVQGRAPIDRLAAMRALAHIGRSAEAIVQGEALRAQLGDLPEQEANAAKSELANLYTAQGYGLRRDKRARDAAYAFEQALTLDPRRARLWAEAGYARLAAGERALAEEHFVRAVEALAAKQGAAAQPGLPDADERELYERVRRELRELRRQWTLALFQSWRARRGSPSAAFAGLQRDGLIAAQAGVELAMRLASFPGLDGDRATEVFVRTLWSQRTDSLAIDSRSVQGAAGIRWQPIAGSAVRLSAERLVALGDDARTDWLIRAAWGQSVGEEAPAGRTTWPVHQVYVDVGRFLRGDGSNAAYGEWRQGLALALSSDWVAVPHIVLAGRAVHPDPFKESWSEAGPGIALRRRFGATAQEADRGRVDISVQYRFAVSGAGRQGWMVTGSLVW